MVPQAPAGHCADFSAVAGPRPHSPGYVAHRLNWYAERLTEERERLLDLDLTTQRQHDQLTDELRAARQRQDRLAADLEAARQRERRLRQELDELQERFVCAVCMQTPRSRAPRCGHFLMCDDCAARARKCPVCRINYTVTKPIFFS